MHFPATELSKERVIKMGEDPNTFLILDAPSIDAIAEIDLSLSKIKKKSIGVGSEIKWDEPYILVLQHPVTTDHSNSMQHIKETINAIHTLKIQTIWLWPNIDAGSDGISKALRVFRENKKPNYINFIKNFSVEDYARVLSNAACAVETVVVL